MSVQFDSKFMVTKVFLHGVVNTLCKPRNLDLLFKNTKTCYYYLIFVEIFSRNGLLKWVCGLCG